MGEVNKLLYQIAQCVDYQCLYALEENFNKVGLTIQTTSNNRMILCRLVSGKIVSERVIDDYIFVGNMKESEKELSENFISKISDFVRNKAGEPSVVTNTARVWRNGIRMYESNIPIMHEDVNKIAQHIVLE